MKNVYAGHIVMWKDVVLLPNGSYAVQQAPVTIESYEKGITDDAMAEIVLGSSDINEVLDRDFGFNLDNFYTVVRSNFNIPNDYDVKTYRMDGIDYPDWLDVDVCELGGSIDGENV